jgi:hypothetical protein
LNRSFFTLWLYQEQTMGFMGIHFRSRAEQLAKHQEILRSEAHAMRFESNKLNREIQAAQTKAKVAIRRGELETSTEYVKDAVEKGRDQKQYRDIAKTLDRQARDLNYVKSQAVRDAALVRANKVMRDVNRVSASGNNKHIEQYHRNIEKLHAASEQMTDALNYDEAGVNEDTQAEVAALAEEWTREVQMAAQNMPAPSALPPVYNPPQTATVENLFN